MKRVRRWDMPAPPPPKHPYRDTVLVYGALAAVVVVVSVLTGGAWKRAVTIAALFFVVAVAWSWRNWRLRLRARRDRADR